MDMADDGAQPLMTWYDFHTGVRAIVKRIKDRNMGITHVCAIPRGGLVLGTMLSHALSVPLVVQSLPLPSDPTTMLVCDDNAITGDSLAPFSRAGMPCAVIVKHPNANTCEPFLYAYESDEMWLFPWETEAAHEPADIDAITC